MKKLIGAAVIAAISGSVVFAATADDIKARQSAMKTVGKAAKAGDFAAMNEGAIAAKAAFAVDTTGSGGDTEASDKIWSDAAGFGKIMDELVTLSAAGDKAVFGTCKACHKGYRVKK